MRKALSNTVIAIFATSGLLGEQQRQQPRRAAPLKAPTDPNGRPIPEMLNSGVKSALSQIISRSTTRMPLPPCVLHGVGKE